MRFKADMNGDEHRGLFKLVTSVAGGRMAPGRIGRHRTAKTKAW
jgi:hypothetical protein